MAYVFCAFKSSEDPHTTHNVLFWKRLYNVEEQKHTDRVLALLADEEYVPQEMQLQQLQRRNVGVKKALNFKCKDKEDCDKLFEALKDLMEDFVGKTIIQGYEGAELHTVPRENNFKIQQVIDDKGYNVVLKSFNISIEFMTMLYQLFKNSTLGGVRVNVYMTYNEPFNPERAKKTYVKKRPE